MSDRRGLLMLALLTTAFLGPRTGEELVRHYRAADVFVFPSRTDTLGLVMLDMLRGHIEVGADRSGEQIRALLGLTDWCGIYEHGKDSCTGSAAP